MQNTKRNNRNRSKTEFVDLAGRYLEKHTIYPGFICRSPEKDLSMAVVIPARNESRLTESLDSLFRCKSPEGSVEILVVINSTENTEKSILVQNDNTLRELEEYGKKNNHQKIKVYAIHLSAMPEKHSGVGLARKAGMDEAIKRFVLAEKEGIILSFDADCKCDENYLIETEKYFQNNPDNDGCTFYFEHPLQGDEYKKEVYEAILNYELHQRYYLQGLRYANHPNCFHTIGSAFAVKAGTYCKQGGMNKRKAGEDFYFLQKLFDLGNFSECNTTMVIPSPRPSNRVPFGTGPVVMEYLQTRKELMSFNPVLFTILKKILARVPSFYNARKDQIDRLIPDEPIVLKQFLIQNNFYEKILEIQANSSDKENFIKRFYRWFNMFRMLKFLNFSKSQYPDLPVIHGAQTLLKYMGLKNIPDNGKELLDYYRKKERIIPPQQ